MPMDPAALAAEERRSLALRMGELFLWLAALLLRGAGRGSGGGGSGATATGVRQHDGRDGAAADGRREAARWGGVLAA